MTKTQQYSHLMGLTGNAMQPSTLQTAAVDTPTIVDKLAQWLQAEKCQEMHESYERTGNVDALALQPPEVNNSYISNKTLQAGGTITINPTTFVRLSNLEDNTDRIPVVVNEVIEEQKLPLPVVQTNRKRTMVTRSLSRQVSEVNNIKEEQTDPDYAPEAAPPAAKKSRRSQAGRKPKSTRGDYLDELPAEEQEKVLSRRQKNKEAAARCRQKRVDTTVRLEKEVAEHQAAKLRLEQEIKKLRMESENLRRVLANHQAYGCRLNNQQDVISAHPEPLYTASEAATSKPFAVAIKSAPVIVEAANAPYVLPDVTSAEHQPLTKPSRPQTLTLGVGGSKSEVKGFLRDQEELETPSKIVANLFEQTGFTPTSIFGNMVPSLNTPTCSVQQRMSGDVMGGASTGELNTPCNDTGISLTAL